MKMKRRNRKKARIKKSHHSKGQVFFPELKKRTWEKYEMIRKIERKKEPIRKKETH